MKASVTVYFVVRESKCVMATHERTMAEDYIATFNKHCGKAAKEARMITRDVEIEVD